ncbi:MAG: endolytic transglycosylase MltG [Aggregatilineales bacterium]
MNRTLRSLLVLVIALGFASVVCLGLVFLLAGDDIVDFLRVAPARFNVFLNRDALDEPTGESTDPVRFLVANGDTPPVISQNLLGAGLINDSELFVDYVRAQSLDVELEAGVYFFSETQTIRQIALALTDSSTSQITFSILPGWRIEEVAAAIDVNPLFGFSGSEFLNVVGRGAQVDPAFAQLVGLPVGASLEGFLFPDSYSLSPDITPIGLRDVLLESFRAGLSTQVIDDIRDQGFSIFDIVTFASIVQREAVQTEEYPVIASVYRNRYDISMNLEADPTVQYPLGNASNWWPRITAADYQGVISDYNTYRINGLPPGPIASPGLRTIEATVYPDETPFFFFRADCRTDGYHDFAITFEEHLANGC